MQASFTDLRQLEGKQFIASILTWLVNYPGEEKETKS